MLGHTSGLQRLQTSCVVSVRATGPQDLGLSKDVGQGGTTRHMAGRTERERETLPGVFNFVLAASACFMAAPREAGGSFRLFGSHLNQTEVLAFGSAFPERSREANSVSGPHAL